jgi:hypothetical protein
MFDDSIVSLKPELANRRIKQFIESKQYWIFSLPGDPAASRAAMNVFITIEEKFFSGSKNDDYHVLIIPGDGINFIGFMTVIIAKKEHLPASAIKEYLGTDPEDKDFISIFPAGMSDKESTRDANAFVGWLASVLENKGGKQC